MQLLIVLLEQIRSWTSLICTTSGFTSPYLHLLRSECTPHTTQSKARTDRTMRWEQSQKKHKNWEQAQSRTNRGSDNSWLEGGGFYRQANCPIGYSWHGRGTDRVCVSVCVGVSGELSSRDVATWVCLCGHMLKLQRCMNSSTERLV